MDRLGRRAMPAALVVFAFAPPVAAAVLAAPCGAVAMYGVFNCMPWAVVIQPLVDSLTGPTAVIVSILGVAVAGGMMMFGAELSDWTRRMVMICLTVGLLTGSKTFLWALFGMSGAVVP